MEQLTVPGELASLKLIAEFVLAEASKVGLDKKASYRLRLAIDEIATNIILYGFHESAQKGDLHLSATTDNSKLEIAIEDSAIPFDPINARQVEATELERPLEERQVGGLGVYLAIQGVDQFRYERVSDRNRNIFVMNLA
ncbi:MAG: ATP-binding protein [Tildeniella torsiva UHER 1998/13D]|jgi:anti-sigma regulatory factor (Ser/Thr protein kinase)|nr:ATP-binding protein [Tildeniella torsiva UHER 1998/13D]